MNPADMPKKATTTNLLGLLVYTPVQPLDIWDEERQQSIPAPHGLRHGRGPILPTSTWNSWTCERSLISSTLTTAILVGGKQYLNRAQIFKRN